MNGPFPTKAPLHVPYDRPLVDPCDNCHGFGELYGSPCPVCDGSGEVAINPYEDLGDR